MDSILTQLLEMSQKLKDWIGIDDGNAFIAAVKSDASNIPTYATGASPEAVAAGLLYTLEMDAQALRRYFNITFTTHGQIKIDNEKP